VYPKLYESSHSDNEIYNKVISIIKIFESKSYFNNLIGLDSKTQKKIVTNFQKDLKSFLEKNIVNSTWYLEYKPNLNQKDSIDIYGEFNNFSIIIELDKHRADQISKKFLSRTALFINKNILYVSLCYGGTSNMPVQEAKKYFKYCRILSEHIKNTYAGFIIE